MFTINDFHDKDFDGVVIKLPSSFFVVNPLLLDKLKDALSSCEFSLQHPHYERSVYEVNNYTIKSQKARELKEREETARNKAIERETKLLNKTILECVEEKLNINTSNDDGIHIDGEYFHDFYTKSGKVKADVQKKFDEFISKADLISFNNFCVRNSIYMNTSFITPLFEISRCRIYVDGRYNLAMSVQVHVVRDYNKSTQNGKIYYREQYLCYNNERNEYYLSGGKFGDLEIDKSSGESRVYLSDYTLSNNLFIKKEL